MLTFADEVKELHEIYQYMIKEGFTDRDFLTTANDLVRKNTYSRKALEVMTSVYGINISLDLSIDKLNISSINKNDVKDSIKKVISSPKNTNKDKDPCSKTGGFRRPPCS